MKSSIINIDFNISDTLAARLSGIALCFLLFILVSMHFFVIISRRSIFIEFDHFILGIISFPALLVIISRRYLMTIRITPTLILSLIILVLIFISISINGSVGSSSRYLLLTIVFVFFCLLKNYKLSIPIIIISLFILCLFLFIEETFFDSIFYLKDQIDINSGENANFFACIFPFILGITFQFFKTKESATLRIISCLTLFLVLYLVFSFRSRTACLAMTVSTCLFFISSSRVLGYLKSINLTKVGCIIFIIFFGITVLGYFLYSLNPESVAGRVLIFKVSYNILIDHPWLGIGLGNFEKVYNLYQAQYFTDNPQGSDQIWAQNTYYAFNEFLQLLVELGIIISLSILACVAMIIFQIRKKLSISSNCVIRGTICAIAGIMICSLFSYPLHTLSIEIILFLYISILLTNLTEEKKSSPIKHSTILATSLFMIPLAFIISYCSWNTFKHEKIWRQTAFASLNGDFESASKQYKIILPHLPNNPKFLLNYGMELSIAGDYKSGLQILKRCENLYSNNILSLYLAFCYDHSHSDSFAEKYYKQAVYIVPSSFTSRHFLLNFYVNRGNLKKSTEIAKEIIELPIKIPSQDIDEIKKNAKKILNNDKNENEKSIL